MEALQRRQREFTALAENMNEGVLLLDGQYHILSSNQGAMALLGQEEKPEDLQEDSRREIRVAAGRALAGHHAQSLMDLGEQVIEILANPVKLPSGNVIDAATADKILINDSLDPFSRLPFTKEDLVPLPDLKAQIEAFKKDYRASHAKKSNDNDGDVDMS